MRILLLALSFLRDYLVKLLKINLWFFSLIFLLSFSLILAACGSSSPTPAPTNQAENVTASSSVAATNVSTTAHSSAAVTTAASTITNTVGSSTMISSSAATTTTVSANWSVSNTNVTTTTVSASGTISNSTVTTTIVSASAIAIDTIAATPTPANVTAAAGQQVEVSGPTPSPTPVGPDKRTVLTVWTDGWTDNSQVIDYFNKLIDSYRTLHPNFTVDWQDYGADTFSKLTTAFSSNTNVPDLILVNPADLYNFAANGYLSDLDSLAGNSLQTNYVQSAWNALQWNSHSYGIPWVATSRVTLINKTLWQKAGLNTSALPKTFDDLNKDLPNLRDKTPKDVTAVWLHPDPLADFMMEGVKLYQTNGDGASNVAAFNTSAAQGRWDYYVQLRKGLYFAQSALSGSTQDALNLYGQQKLVMVTDGTDLLSSLKSQFLDVYTDTLVTLYPLSAGKNLPLTMQGWAIPKNATNSKDALDFVQYITNKDNELAFAKLYDTYVPTVRAALLDPYVNSYSDPLSTARAIIAANLSIMQVPEQQLPEPITPDLRNKLIDALVSAESDAWNEKQTPKNALAAAEKTWNQLLK